MKSKHTILYSQFLAIGCIVCAAVCFMKPAMAASSPGDVVGKVTVGYQGWFACSGDGSPFNGWWHQSPSPAGQGIKDWPDVREYTKTYPTQYANLGNGQPAKLFSSFDQSTVNTQFLWMHQYGIDCAALQRFNPFGGEGPIRDSIANKVRIAAEAYSVKFYIMYDVTGWSSAQTQLKTDWTNKMSKLTSSPMYAQQNGKPVVDVWGFGYHDGSHPVTTAAAIDIITWLKGQGCYVIGGVPREWRSSTADLTMYHSLDMISPWMVGALGSVSGADGIYNNYILGDQADCNAHNMDYQPCVIPGDNSIRQRAHGELMWRMFYNAIRAGCQGIYISMYDEFNEGNQICKTAENASMLPVGSSFRGLDEDGTVCSSDYYLRIAGDGARMLKGQMALTATRPTQPVGPIGVIFRHGGSSGSGTGAGTVLKAGTRGSSQVSLSLPVKTLSLAVYDICGSLVANVPVVNNAAVWNGTDASGKQVSAGGYFARATNGKQSVARPFVLQ
jgi:hypothetical protein